MEFSPCVDQCSYDGTHCEGCGRSHEEIAQTKKLVMGVVNFIKEQEYDNPDEFMAVMTKSVLKRLKK